VALVVIPLDCEAAVQCAGPISGDFVQAGKGVDKVLGVCFVGVFDAKVVNHQGEFDVAAVVPPQVMGARDWAVAILGQVFDDTAIGNDAGLL
jgi:hypothetical protein